MLQETLLEQQVAQAEAMVQQDLVEQQLLSKVLLHQVVEMHPPLVDQIQTMLTHFTQLVAVEVAVVRVHG
jgi:hypothetical protein